MLFSSFIANRDFFTGWDWVSVSSGRYTKMIAKGAVSWEQEHIVTKSFSLHYIYLDNERDSLHLHFKISTLLDLWFDVTIDWVVLLLVHTYSCFKELVVGLLYPNQILSCFFTRDRDGGVDLQLK